VCSDNKEADIPRPTDAARQTSDSAIADLQRQVARLEARMLASHERRVATLGELQTIVASISKIATTMKRLTINGSIEASRAGTAGAGFAVVVTEMRGLADATKAAAGKADDLLARRARDQL
jgi:methyl-accepting chemotaxis protein